MLMRRYDIISDERQMDELDFDFDPPLIVDEAETKRHMTEKREEGDEGEEGEEGEEGDDGEEGDEEVESPPTTSSPGKSSKRKRED